MEEEQKNKKKMFIIAGCALAGLVAVVMIILWACGVFSSETGPDNPSGSDAGTTAQNETSRGWQESKNPTETENSSQAQVSNIRYSSSVSNQWGGNGQYFKQYDLTAYNDGSEKVTSWKVQISGFDGFKVEQSWNCTVVVENHTLIITPVDFNSVIEPGKSASGAGLIISSNSDSVLAAGKIEAQTEGGSLVASGEPQGGSSQGNSPSGEGGNSGGGNQGGDNPSGGGGSSGTVPGPSGGGYAPEDGTPVANHGRLRVDGTRLVDAGGNPYQLRGVSTHGMAWFPAYVNKEAFRTFRDEWHCNVIRLAMYTGEYGGYCSGGSQAELKALVDAGVSYAAELGLYVIIDWHILSDNNPHINKASAIAFFDEMSSKYAGYENVIYEICNEPNGGTGWGDVKSYAQEVIGVIRSNDPNGVILVGTPQWCQLVMDAANDPVQGYENIMYTLHFYAATHGEWLRNNMVSAIQSGLPVFVSECSICDASGNGGIDYGSAQAWVDLMDAYGVSYVAWNISNKAETSSLIQSWCDKVSGWADEELSDTGKWFKQIFTR